MSKECFLCVIGSPLADVVVQDVSEEIFQKFGLPKDGTVVGSPQLFEVLLSDSASKVNSLTMGGSALNTLRVIRAAANYSNQMRGIFLGSATNDCVTRQLKSKMEKNEGIVCKFQVLTSPEVHSGCCFCLPHQNGRCMVTFPSASRLMSPDFVKTGLEQLPAANCKGVLMVNYLFNISPILVKNIAGWCLNNKVPIILSLSSPLLCSKFADKINDILLSQPNLVKLIMGNRAEVLTLARKLTGKEELSLDDSMSFLADPPFRSVLTTCGGDRKFYISDSTGAIRKFDDEAEGSLAVVDTTGAGDGFAGGFLAKFLTEEPLEVCAEAGFYWARKMVQQEGCQIPNKDSSLTLCRNEVPSLTCTFCAKFATK